MITANDRFKELRKACGKTQEEWGKIIGITKNGVCDIESGRRNVTDKHLVALGNYKDKSINTEWIKTGIGDMFKKRTRNQEISDFANNIMEDLDESFRKRLMLALSKLNESDWETIEKIVDLLIKEG